MNNTIRGKKNVIYKKIKELKIKMSLLNILIIKEIMFKLNGIVWLMIL